MALHVPRAPGISQMFQEGTKHFHGVEEAMCRNIEACVQLADTLRTTYGPYGMNKLIINHLEKMFVTSDAAVILNELEIQHPAAKLIVFASDMQEREVGDGTSFVIIFAGALLKNAEELLKMGLAPSEIIHGYDLALEKTLEILPNLMCTEVKDCSNEDEAVKGIKASLMSKAYGNEDFLARLVAKSCILVKPEKGAFNVDNVRVSKIVGCGIDASNIVEGMVFKRMVEGDIQKVEKAPVVVFTCPFDSQMTETKGTVLIQSANELLNYSRGEETLLEQQIKEIADSGVKVIVSGGKFGDMALHYLNKFGIMAVRLQSKFDVRRLCKTVGATPLPKVSTPTKEELGFCDQVYVSEIGDTPVVIFKQENKQSLISTIVIRGSTDSLMDEFSRAIDDGVNNFKALSQDGRLVPGAGATEIELAKQITKYGETLPGLEQYSVKKFADALEALPKALADNAGLKSSEIISKLYAAHQEGDRSMGIDIEGEHAVKNVEQAGILDLYITKHWAIKNAAVVVNTILRVDQSQEMSDNDKKTKFKRKFISLDVKIQILDRLLKGERAAHIAKTLNLSEATIRTIKKNEEKIRSAVTAGSPVSAKYASRTRPPIIEKMEKALSIWFDDSCQKRIPLDSNIIKQKALNIYKHLKENGESPVSPDFVASKGWFEKFKKRFAIRSTRIQGKSSSTDHEAAGMYPEYFQKIIEEQGYTPHQVFNADETGLWWKKMPKKIFMDKTAPSKISQDRVMLLLCSNASGDFITKPLLVNRSLNPRALKGVNKNTLPVYWKANSKAWVTEDLFKEWFLRYFVPEVETYLKKKNLDFKVLLLLDNALSHPQDLSHPNVQVMFLPPNTASLLQPLDQGIIYNFRTYYFRRSLQWILDMTESQSIGVMEAWKQFSIKHCIEVISLSLEELNESMLNACWKKVWPSSVEIGNGNKLLENGIGAILELAKLIGREGFENVTVRDVQDLWKEEEIDEGDLLELASEDVNKANSEESSSDEDREGNKLTLKKLQKGLSLAKNLESFFSNVDPSAERSQKFKRDLQDCISPYQEIYNDLLKTKKQRKISGVIKREEGTNDEKDSESEDDNTQAKKRLRLSERSSDEEENY